MNEEIISDIIDNFSNDELSNSSYSIEEETLSFDSNENNDISTNSIKINLLGKKRNDEFIFYNNMNSESNDDSESSELNPSSIEQSFFNSTELKKKKEEIIKLFNIFDTIIFTDDFRIKIASSTGCFCFFKKKDNIDPSDFPGILFLSFGAINLIKKIITKHNTKVIDSDSESTNKKFNYQICFDDGDIFKNMVYKKIQIQNKLLFVPMNKYQLKLTEYRLRGFCQIMEELGAIEIEIEFNNAKISYNDNTLSFNDGVKIYHTSSGLEAQSKNLTFNNLKNTVSSKTKSKIFDLNKNIYTVDSFLFEIGKDLIKVNNLSFTNKDNDKFETSVGFINLKTGNLFGKDINVNLNEKNFDKDNQPRLKGNSIEYNKDKTIISKGVFTTCKKRDGCPPWKLTANTVSHDKKKQVVNYDHAVLSVYDVPVLYFPKFFHPDPTVERRSGFLQPQFNNSETLGSSLYIPYFKTLGPDKDLTIKPTFFEKFTKFKKEKYILQSEFRKQNQNSSLIADFAFLRDYTSLADNKTKNVNHLFLNYTNDLQITQLAYIWTYILHK